MPTHSWNTWKEDVNYSPTKVMRLCDAPPSFCSGIAPVIKWLIVSVIFVIFLFLFFLQHQREKRIHKDIKDINLEIEELASSKI